MTMDAYVTEEQQVEAIKKWFKKYGDLLSWVAIAVLSVVLLSKYWFHHQEVVQQRASDSYAMLIHAQDSKDDATMQSQTNLLMTDYAKTPYATFSSLAMAKMAIERADWVSAQQSLEWVLEHAKQEDFKALARVRLMRLLISQDKLPEALALYSDKKETPFSPILAELKGDILMKQNDIEGAKAAYKKAWSLAPKEDMVGYLLKIKLEALGIVN